MVFFAKLLSFVLVALSAHAVPFPATSKHTTHRTRVIGRRAITVEAYHPPTDYKTFGAEGKDIPASFAAQSLEDVTKSVVASELGIDTDKISFTSGFANDVSYTYAKQEGVEFTNAVANVAIKDNKLVAFGASFVDTSNIADSTPTIDVASVIPTIEEQLDGTFNGDTKLNYLALDDGSVALTHAIQIQNEETNAWFEAYVDAHTGELLSVADFVAELSYRVIPIEIDAGVDGFEQELLVDPENLDSSPAGWVTSTATEGNNVVSFKGTQTNTTTGFNFTYDLTLAPTAGSNIDAARVNSFYLINAVHDILYQYGWTESSFNFQTDNFGKGGAGNDRVLMSVQDASGTNNANFATPPDGRSGTCAMGLQNDIVVHEFTHGLTNRMTGGGTATCLQTLEGGRASSNNAACRWTEQTSAETPDKAMGVWVLDDAAGVRSHPYSTSATVNPLRYSSLQTLNEVHDIGEVWTNILYNVYAALVGELGWSATAKTDSTGSEGNIVWLHLFVDALALQPCNPTFVTARDAWIQADVNRYGGANACTLWTAFASRGLGVGAANHVDNSDVPSGC
ncbi:Fungalysin metallopeptidase-domain-containing protein [Mucidula mucida]|nr:Fungalysin metallopeptidase-domain-containing protein [Mucidula mucida]